jgi:quercetin dioxygenase-like cupin family protein
MKRTISTIAIGTLLGAVGLMLAPNQGNPQEHQAHARSGESVRIISSQDIKEKLDNKDTAATVVEVTLEPAEAGVPHRHPGPAFVYVLEGEYELGIDDQPTKVFKAGETFYEPTGCLHRVSKNPSDKNRTRLIAVVLHPQGIKEIAVPEQTKEPHS